MSPFNDCPFCGSDDISEVDVERGRYGNEPRVVVQCQNCFASSIDTKSLAEATAAWNLRRVRNGAIRVNNQIMEVMRKNEVALAVNNKIMKYGRHLYDKAKEMGRDENDQEGPLEFIIRTSYLSGLNDRIAADAWDREAHP